MSGIKRCCFALLAAAVSCVSAPAAFAARDVKVFLDDNEVKYDVPAQIISERTMVPLSKTIEAITGAPAQWDDPTKTVTFYANGHTNIHKIGEKIVYVDGKAVEFPTPSLIVNSRTLVPVRMIAETSGCGVEWDGSNYYVVITGKPSPAPAPAPAAPSDVKIISATAGKTTINEGDPVVVTVKTNGKANYVWVDYGSLTADASFQSKDVDGNKTWTATCYPRQAKPVTVYANTDNNINGAARQTVKVTVNPTAETIKIFEINADRTTSNPGEPVTLTIRTNSAASFVWAEFDMGRSDMGNATATQTSESASGDKTWAVICYPTKTQRIRVYANNSKSTAGAATDGLTITVIDQTTPNPLMDDVLYE